MIVWVYFLGIPFVLSFFLSPFLSFFFSFLFFSFHLFFPRYRF